MTYTRFNTKQSNSLQLQSIGHVAGTPAGEIKVGDRLMWNFGSTTTVKEIVKTTKCTLTVIETSDRTGADYTRRLNKTRLVCILRD